MMPFVRPTIAREIRKRGITLLLHSTHLHRNLPLILSDGCIHTAQELIARYGPERAARLLHDPRRYEQFAVGLDYVNGSLTAPNVELLYHRSQSEWRAEWVHLALDLKLLELPSTRFCPLSAATGRGQHITSGLDGFRSLFADSVETFSRQSLPAFEPTHPQAEILIHGSVDWPSIQAVYVPNRNTLLEVSRFCEQHRRSVPVHIAPYLFVWPARLTNSIP